LVTSIGISVCATIKMPAALSKCEKGGCREKGLWRVKATWFPDPGRRALLPADASLC
jgi:hypothetical protein